MPRKIPFSAAMAVAMHIGEDVDEVKKNRRYQPTRTPCPVFTVGNDYLTATNGKRKPRESRDYQWAKVKSSPVDTLGWNIWKHLDR